MATAGETMPRGWQGAAVNEIRWDWLLTHLPIDKMTANLSDDIFKYIFFDEKYSISIRISLKFVPRGLIDNRPVLVQVIAWRRTGDKPLPEQTLTQFTDACICGTWGRWINKVRIFNSCCVEYVIVKYLISKGGNRPFSISHYMSGVLSHLWSNAPVPYLFRAQFCYIPLNSNSVSTKSWFQFNNKLWFVLINHTGERCLCDAHNFR